ncbi:unnamed protein product [Brassica rapa subsp. narinosa]|uniref:(rape) hypothetical protein n=1 Tax=Brassica napus TaxID=3708 RepID=A0A817B883_BRANA|nr:unnamed protein product [Brassica napus]
MIQEPKTMSPPPIDVANTDTPSKLLSQVIFIDQSYYIYVWFIPFYCYDDGQQLSAALPNIENHVVINQKLSGFATHFPFQRVVSLAMDRAIKEIVSGIVRRSVCIACQTTKELVLKDYALEPDEARIYSAAHLMVASLAGSFAHVTCKEPLRTSISRYLRHFLQDLNIKSEALEQIVQLVTNDNLDLGCAAIEQAATEKAVQAIDADIAHQLLLRRDGAGSSLSQNSVSFIPESLRPKLGQLSLSQHRVYEEFVQLPWQKQSTHTSHGLSGEVGLGSGYGPV